MENKDRDHRIDMLRGILIILVMMGHYHLPQLDMVFIAGGIFRMPLFIAMSCLLVKSGNWEFLKKRATIVLTPYFFWNGIFLFASWISDETANKDNYIYGKLASIVWVSWFLPAIFVINVLFAFYKSSLRFTFFKTILPVTILLISFWLFWNAPKINSYNAPYLIIEDLIYFFYLFPLLLTVSFIWAKKTYFTDFSISVIIFTIICSYAIFFFLEGMKPSSSIGRFLDLKFLIFPYTFTGNILVLIITSCFFILALKLPSIPFFIYIGKYSFPIFLLHLCVIVCLGDIIYMVKDKYFYNETLLHKSYIVVAYTIIYPLTLLICISISNGLMYLTPYARFIGMAKNSLPRNLFRTAAPKNNDLFK